MDFLKWIGALIFLHGLIAIGKIIFDYIDEKRKPNKEKYNEAFAKAEKKKNSEIKEIVTVEYFCNEMMDVLDEIIDTYDSKSKDYFNLKQKVENLFWFFIDHYSVDKIAKRRKLYYENNNHNNMMTYLYNEVDLDIVNFWSVLEYLKIYDDYNDVVLLEHKEDLVEKEKYIEGREYFLNISKHCVSERKRKKSSFEEEIRTLKLKYPH